jgi:hypothetical protein
MTFTTAKESIFSLSIKSVGLLYILLVSRVKTLEISISFLNERNPLLSLSKTLGFPQQSHNQDTL